MHVLHANAREVGNAIAVLCIVHSKSDCPMEELIIGFLHRLSNTESMIQDDYFIDNDFASDDIFDEDEANSPDYSYPSVSSEIKDSLFDEAKSIVVRYQIASTNILQRKLNIGYNHAVRILDQLEKAGYVGPAEGGSRSRNVLILELDGKKSDDKKRDQASGKFETEIKSIVKYDSVTKSSGSNLTKTGSLSSGKSQYSENVKAIKGGLTPPLKGFVYLFLIFLAVCFLPLLLSVLLIWGIVAGILELLFPGKDFMPLRKIWTSSKRWMQDKLGIDLEKVVGGAVLALIMSAILSFLVGLFSRDE